MGRTLLAAFLGGVFASLLTFFLATTLASGPEREEAARRMEAAEAASETAQAHADLAARRVETLERRLQEATRNHAEAVGRIEAALTSGGARAAEGGEGAAPEGAVAPDGSPYVSRAELEAALARSARVAVAAEPAAVPEQKSLEEIVRDMNLGSSEEASLRIALRESEEELVRCIFGDRPIAEIVADAQAAKEDPDRAEAFVTAALSNGFSNFGKLATLQMRTRKKVEGILGREKAAEFMAKPRRPLLGAEFERVFKDLDFK